MEKMRFEEFTNAVVEKIREYLPENFANAQIELNTVKKNNDLKLTGLSIRTVDSNISPMIYLEQFFDKYQEGQEMSEVLKHIADARIQCEVKEAFDVGQITDFTRVKDHIVPHLIGKAWNEALLKERPHTVIADLAVTYHVLIGSSRDTTASAVITNKMMEMWDVTVEELHELAIRNMTTLLPSEFVSMNEIMRRIMGDEADEMLPVDGQMYVLSNSTKVHGASALLDKEIMDKVIDRIGDGFYVLPSSVHEVICLKMCEEATPENLSAMVKDVNGSQVARDEWLSDHAYRYTKATGLCVA